jgi:hypothetical protein
LLKNLKCPPQELKFLPYSSQQLQDIVRHRCSSAKLDDNAVKLVAGRVGAGYGDCRLALDISRTAGRAGGSGDRVVTAKDIAATMSGASVNTTIEILAAAASVSLIAAVKLASSRSEAFTFEQLVQSWHRTVAVLKIPTNQRGLALFDVEHLVDVGLLKQRRSTRQNRPFMKYRLAHSVAQMQSLLCRKWPNCQQWLMTSDDSGVAPVEV